MPSIIIPAQHQSVPPEASGSPIIRQYYQPAEFGGKSRFPKGFRWWYFTKQRPYESELGLHTVGLQEQLHFIIGAKGQFCLSGWFVERPWKGEGYDLYETRMAKVVHGIMHDVEVCNQGGDAKGDMNKMLNKLMTKAGEEFDIDPGVIQHMIQDQDLQGAN